MVRWEYLRMSLSWVETIMVTPCALPASPIIKGLALIIVRVGLDHRFGQRFCSQKAILETRHDPVYPSKAENMNG